MLVLKLELDRRMVTLQRIHQQAMCTYRFAPK
jgi:hypothetical protein